jgi:peroxiredoxin
MKKQFAYLISLSLVIVTMISCSPNPKDILAGSYIKCQSIQNGYYEMENYWKMMSRNDTMQITQQCHFKKIENDSILPFIFNSHLCSGGIDRSGEITKINLLYTGDEFVMYSGSNGHIMQRKENGNNVWLLYNKNTAFNSYLPITYKDSKPIPSPPMLASGKFTASYVKQEKINGIQCYQIKAVVPKEFDISTLRNQGFIIRTEFNYWISKQDSIPIQITVSRDLKIGNDTLVEFQKLVLTKYELNKLPDEALFTLQSIPHHVNLQAANNAARKQPLTTGDIAPNWRLPTTKGDTLSLTGFRGNLVLLDFFVVSCPPCVGIVPALTSLHKKYKEQGLRVIGQDVLDSQKTLHDFIVRHNIEYPLLLSNKNITHAYNISGYPTTYLIGKDGKILFSHVGGYDQTTLKKLDNLIQQYLE